MPCGSHQSYDSIHGYFSTCYHFFRENRLAKRTDDSINVRFAAKSRELLVNYQVNTNAREEYVDKKGGRGAEIGD